MTSARLSRREFLERGRTAALALPVIQAARAPAADRSASLEALATRLLGTWGEGLLRFQARTLPDPAFRGGLLCPGCARIHGRVGDAAYPFLRLARTTKDARYLDAARGVFDWMSNVDRADGSWVNDPFNEWRGTTVFGVIALADALRHHGELLRAADRARMTDRLAKAARFLDGFLTPTIGNVNYRMSAPLAFALAALVLGEPRYRERARDFATLVRGSFLASGLIFGEGHPNDRVSARGCRAIDLGYDVEESLPNLAAYAALVDDRDLLALVARSLRAHLDFMLPDGGWDNSWGTRNYKWTYWGSRTSDGAGLGLVLAGENDPMFLEAALRNLQLLERCTHDGLLHGGPHLHLTGQRPCLHHTFTHAKMLAAILDHGVPKHRSDVALPRQTAQGVRHHADIDTWLVARGPWRATVTANDWQYVPEGNASGGALSLLWHERVGVIVSASMTQYQMVEANNQALHAGRTMTLTPGLEATRGAVVYRSLNDLAASVESHEVEDGFELVSRGRLVDREQQAASPAAPYRLAYHFTDEAVHVRVSSEGPAGTRFALPIVSASDEPVTVRGPGEIEVVKPGGVVRVTSSRPLRAFSSERLFNHVPGFQALDLTIDLPPNQEAVFEIRIL